MAAVRFPKTEAVLSQPWIEISHRNLVGLRVDGVDVDATNAQSGTAVFICWSVQRSSVADVELSLTLLRFLICYLIVFIARV